MKTTFSSKLTKLAHKLYVYVCIDEVINDKKIPCIAIPLDNPYTDDIDKAFEFGYKYWWRKVIYFTSPDCIYYAVASEDRIEDILKKELKEIERETKS